jgi:hypothetical protein
MEIARGLKVRVLSLELLIKSKEETARDKDTAMLAALHPGDEIEAVRPRLNTSPALSTYGATSVMNVPQLAASTIPAGAGDCGIISFPIQMLPSSSETAAE